MQFSRRNTVLVDFEYHVGNNKEVIIKELALLKGNSMKVHTYLFTPPYPRSQLTFNAARLMRQKQEKSHGLDWSAGEYPYTYVAEIFGFLNSTSYLTNLLVNGSKKAKYLRKFSPKVKDIGILMDYDAYKRFDHDCPFHEYNFRHCASHHVYQLNMYMTEQNLYY